MPLVLKRRGCCCSRRGIECAMHHKRDVRSEQRLYSYVARTTHVVWLQLLFAAAVWSFARFRSDSPIATVVAQLLGKNTDISYRRASNVTKLCSMQTLASQPRSSGWLSQPWGHWQWQQLAVAADSWIFVDSRTQTRAECKHPVDASMQF